MPKTRCVHSFRSVLINTHCCAHITCMFWYHMHWSAPMLQFLKFRSLEKAWKRHITPKLQSEWLPIIETDFSTLTLVLSDISCFLHIIPQLLSNCILSYKLVLHMDQLQKYMLLYKMEPSTGISHWTCARNAVIEDRKLAMSYDSKLNLFLFQISKFLYIAMFPTSVRRRIPIVFSGAF